MARKPIESTQTTRAFIAGERRRCRAAVRRIDRSLIALRGHMTLPDGEGVITVAPGGVAMLGTPLLPAPESQEQEVAA